MTHKHESTGTYTRSDDPDAHMELHRCACGAAGSRRPGHAAIAWFFDGRFHDVPRSRVVHVLDRAMQRELDELSPSRIERDRAMVCAAVVIQLLQIPEHLPFLQRVVEVNRAITRAFHGLLTHAQTSIRGDTKTYAALLRNGRDLDGFEELLRRSIGAREDLLEAYVHGVDPERERG